MDGWMDRQIYPRLTHTQSLINICLPSQVAEATLAWTDRPAPSRPRHVSTVAAASPPWQATTFARNAAQLQRKPFGDTTNDTTVDGFL
jgi:hypothetical protein